MRPTRSGPYQSTRLPPWYAAYPANGAAIAPSFPDLSHALLPDERALADAFALHLGPVETWYDGTFGLRPAGDWRRIRLKTSFVHEVARMRASVRARIVAAVVAAFTTSRHTVAARLIGTRTLRASQLADVDVLELRLDDAPWAPAGEIRAA